MRRLTLMCVWDPLAAPGLPLGEMALAGLDIVQMRSPGAPGRAVYEAALEAREATGGTGCRLVVNDRLDVALAVGADGAHLGWRSLPLERARAVAQRYRTGPGTFLLGCSVHSVEEAEAAASGGADYVVYGPVFDTPSKRGLLAPRGLDGLQAAAERCGVAVIAIGGVDTGRVPGLVAAGAQGVAATRALVIAPAPIAAVREFRAALDGNAVLTGRR
ncbi:MAG: thiamine phosphate synthase [Candidatus Schekmanbacteria bacterium]|nr:thiamine phosphate synthase [Candidatus Schekmanbacteria bacterium]